MSRCPIYPWAAEQHRPVEWWHQCGWGCSRPPTIESRGSGGIGAGSGIEVAGFVIEMEILMLVRVTGRETPVGIMTLVIMPTTPSSPPIHDRRAPIAETGTEARWLG